MTCGTPWKRTPGQLVLREQVAGCTSTANLMAVDWDEVPVNGVNCNLFIPREFLDEVGIRQADVTLGQLLKMFSALQKEGEMEKQSFIRR